ncbi:MAG: Nucleoid-associated protein YbaB [Turneriella sp.]|nr:Nucleoid-associated protein YbaB [Turneriella sp.]
MGFADFKDMLGQMSQARAQMKEVQKKLGSMRVTSETGGGLVKATVDGEANLVDLEIDTSLLDADEIKVLPKLIKKAIQEAQKDARKQVMSDMKGMLGDMM